MSELIIVILLQHMPAYWINFSYGQRKLAKTLLCDSTIRQKIFSLGQPKKYFCFPLPDPVSPVWVGRSVGRKIIFLTSQIPYPLNLIVNSPNIGN